MTNDQKSIAPKKYLLITVLVLFILFLRIKIFTRCAGSNCISFYNDKGTVTLVGMVAEPPETKGKWQRIEIKPDRLIKQTRRVDSVEGKVLVKTRLYPEYHYGDILQLTGELKTPPEFEDFSYKEYLEIEGVYSLMDFPEIERVESKVLSEPGSKEFLRAGLLLPLKNIYTLRERFESVINQILPEPHASLLAGILFGIERSFDEEFYARMQKAGVLHIIVASGYNIMIVSSFFLGLAPIFGRKKNLILATTGVLIYAVIAGMQPPIVRAAIMGGGAILAEAIGKRKDALLWLGFSAFLMLYVNPLLYQSVSFQLSFAAACAVLVLGPLVEKFLQRVPGIFRESLSTTLAVQILTLPIIYFNFHEVSYFSLPVNTLVLVVVPLIMGLGAIATFAGVLQMGFGQFLAFPVWVLLEYFIKVVEVFV